ncbi:MAG: sugar transferase [Pararhodobacter sp.]|nr:sugar transferase [Pararhodobacter sp.]
MQPYPVRVDHAALLPASPARTDRAQGVYARLIKRGIDITGALVALVLAFPVFALLAIALWIEGGNPIYSQTRLGRNGRRFQMLKLRSMVQGAEGRLAACLAADPALRREWELTQKLKNDPRITPLGRLIRKTSLDELPQLFNVLKGDMSLVGPRPMLPDQLPLYLHPSAYLAVRPGLSGLWQVSARNDDSFEVRAQIDKTYVETLSPMVDLRILLSTAGAVINGTGY